MLESKNITILTVDDNDALRHSLSRMLMEGGYKVMEARNGAEALRLVDEGPDLVTLNVHLPDMDGFEVCRQLKRNPRTAHTSDEASVGRLADKALTPTLAAN